MDADYPARGRAPGLRFVLIALAALVGVVLTANLGFWQLRRADQKIALQARMDQRPLLPRLDNRAFTGAPASEAEDLLYRSVNLRGEWLAQHTVFLDNRQMGGRPGFYVVTPLRLLPSGLAVLVQRGWVPRDFQDRAHLPAVPTPTGPVEVAGRIAPAPGKLYEFKGAEQGVIRQNLSPAAFSGEIGVPLAMESVQQLGAADDGLAREWPAVDTGVATHYGYAFQWFALCGLITVLFVWFQVVRRYLLPPR